MAHNVDSHPERRRFAKVFPMANQQEANARLIVPSLNENDVLLGRGKGPSNYVGNNRFLDIIKERREEYTSKDTTYNQKSVIANEVMQNVHSRGGRFLQLVSRGQPMRNVVEEGQWYVESESVVLLKIKQALRAKRDGKSKGAKDTEKEVHESSAQGSDAVHEYEILPEQHESSKIAVAGLEHNEEKAFASLKRSSSDDSETGFDPDILELPIDTSWQPDSIPVAAELVEGFENEEDDDDDGSKIAENVSEAVGATRALKRGNTI